MRKLAWGTVLALLLLFPISLYGQVNLGFKGGMSLSTIGGADVDDVDYRTGFGVGAFLEFPVSDVVSIQPELLYMKRGAEETEAGITVTFAVDYVEIPVLLRLNFPVEGSIAPYFLVGPSIGFKSGCEMRLEDDEFGLGVDCEEVDVEIKTIDFAGVVGAGLSFEAGPGNVTVGARYNYGFISLDDSDAEEDIKGRAFSFLAGYSFPVGGRS